MTKTLYAIRASRGAGSIFGAAEGWVKVDGQVQTFRTMKKAEAEATRLNAGLSTRNVSYRADEYDPYGF
jgi:hypothetical protein